uniref:Reverse transcriptase domain-containing protein n=1 Tax=Globisporangium ultimum (strain ATCC 200006 / CBS 805.95 / DAOM BR144) TaxID=431595 RepID=K3X168_GLOUD
MSYTPQTSAHFQLLKRTTEVKLRELTKHERKLEEHYAALLAKVGVDEDTLAAAGTDATAEELRRQLDGLYEGVKDLQVVQKNVHTELTGIDGLVEFAEADPWTTKRNLQQRTEQILRQVRQKRSLWRHNKLLGALLMESLEEAEAEQTKSKKSKKENQTVEHEEQSGYVAVEDAGPLMGLTKEETQSRLETFFFQTNGVQEDNVVAFLETHVFHQRESYTKAKKQRVQAALKAARERLQAFSTSFPAETVEESEVIACVNGMLREKTSFSDDIVKFLTDVKTNKDMQVELAHVLTIQLSNLKEFGWPAEGVEVNIKRGINGRFRCFLQEDALTALLFHFVGLAWAVEMKEVFTDLLKSLDEDQNYDSNSINHFRRSTVNKFRVSALPESRHSGGDSYDPADDSSDKKISKQDIVRLIFTEANLLHVLQPDQNDCACGKALATVTTDLEFFGPSVSHEAVFACLRVLGVSDAMINMFRNYVKIPLVFPGYDEPRPMQRGLSVGRMMTLFLSEVLLFVMDFQVLATTDVPLFRMHDDIWLFDADEGKVIQAWEEMNRFAAIVGLRFNEEKSGAVRISVCLAATPKETQVSPRLPKNPIKWGLLVIQSNGSVKIAKDQVKAFATEMADRLITAESVLSWINVYNKYMGFFLRNLGSASPVFGLSYVDTILETLKEIHQLIFSHSEGDVLGCVCEKVAMNHEDLLFETVGANSILLPAAWVHWNAELGGLGLFNPFLAIWSLKEPMYTHLQRYHSANGKSWAREKKYWTWEAPFTTAYKKELKDAYDLFAEKVTREGIKSASTLPASTQFWFLKSSNISDKQRNFGRASFELDGTYSLRTFDEFLALVPCLNIGSLYNEYVALVGEVTPVEPPNRYEPHQTAAAALLDAAGVKGPYWKWVSYIYGEQLIEEFGTISFFNRELLPAQLIQTIKSTAISW